MSKNQRLLEEIAELKSKNEKLENKLSSIKKNVETFRDKIDFIEGMYQLSKDYDCKQPKVFGSFVRKIFEFPFALKDFIEGDQVDWKEEYGNFQTGDLDMFLHLETEEEKSSKSINYAQGILKPLDLQLGVYLTTGSDNICPKIGPYIYQGKKLQFSYNDFGTSYKLILKNGDETLNVDMLGSIKSDNLNKNADFLVNNMYLSSDGIFQFNESNSFIRTLSQIKYRVTDLSIPYRFYMGNQEDEKDLMAKYTENISFFKKRVLKIMKSGYTLKGVSCPTITIETDKNEVCPITANPAPFPKIMMECGHALSLMAYEGLISQGYNSLDKRHRCPMCRKHLDIKLEWNVYYPPLNNIKDFENIGSRKKVSDNKDEVKERLKGLLSPESYDHLFDEKKQDIF